MVARSKYTAQLNLQHAYFTVLTSFLVAAMDAPIYDLDCENGRTESLIDVTEQMAPRARRLLELAGTNEKCGLATFLMFVSQSLKKNTC